MTDQTPCEICRNQAEYEFVPPRVTWRCPRCGEFCYDNSEGPPRIRSPDEMVRLSGWVREQNAAGIRRFGVDSTSGDWREASNLVGSRLFGAEDAGQPPTLALLNTVRQLIRSGAVRWTD